MSEEKDGEIEKKKEKTEDPSNKENMLPKETPPPERKDLEVGKEVPLRFYPKTTSNLGSENQDLKEI